MKKLLILGSTGSIGTQTLDVVRQNKDYFEIVGLVCNSNVDLLEKQIDEFKPKYVGIYDKSAKLKAQIANFNLFIGEEEILNLIKEIKCDIVVVAIVGAAGLKPAITAIRSKKDVALATKEVLVLAGELINEELKKNNVSLLPIDSEHSAIWQSLRAGNNKEIEKIILTCSGGPFRGKKKQELERVTPVQALGHPNWKMGRRITIDSSTLMNKGLELIEAKWLFDVSVNQVEVVVHPQSILHSGILFRDGSMIGQFGVPDMRIAIQYALTHPERLKNDLPRLSLAKIGSLTFEKPDIQTFPCLELAYKAIETGGTMPTVLNAVDEIAVSAFLEERIKFLEISEIIAKVMTKHTVIKNPSLEDILDTDRWARETARMFV